MVHNDPSFHFKSQRDVHFEIIPHYDKLVAQSAILTLSALPTREKTLFLHLKTFEVKKVYQKVFQGS
jgi:hypothetical protein